MEREQNPKSAIETAPVERARNLLTPRKHPDPEDIGAKQVAGIVRDLLSACDDLAARREQDIREAVEAERAVIAEQLSASEEVEDTDGDIAHNDGIHYAQELICQRGRATDPATIRREERERIAAAARDTQRWVGGNYPAWAHEMFRQFAAAIEIGDIPDQPEGKEEGS